MSIVVRPRHATARIADQFGKNKLGTLLLKPYFATAVLERYKNLQEPAVNNSMIQNPRFRRRVAYVQTFPRPGQPLFAFVLPGTRSRLMANERASVWHVDMTGVLNQSLSDDAHRAFRDAVQDQLHIDVVNLYTSANRMLLLFELGNQVAKGHLRDVLQIVLRGRFPGAVIPITQVERLDQLYAISPLTAIQAFGHAVQ